MVFREWNHSIHQFEWIRYSNRSLDWVLYLQHPGKWAEPTNRQWNGRSQEPSHLSQNLNCHRNVSFSRCNLAPLIIFFFLCFWTKSWIPAWFSDVLLIYKCALLRFFFWNFPLNNFQKFSIERIFSPPPPFLSVSFLTRNNAFTPHLTPEILREIWTTAWFFPFWYRKCTLVRVFSKRLISFFEKFQIFPTNSH